MRAGERAPALVAVTLALLGAGPMAAAADSPSDSPSRLDRVTAALEREADRLEALAAGWRVGGADWAVDVLAALTVEEERVWRWQVAAADALGSLPGGAVPAEARQAGGPFRQLQVPGLVAGDAAEAARLRPEPGDREGYRRALSRVLGLLGALRAAASSASGLPAPERVCPVAGPLQFEHTWGEERPWGRTHKGEDVHAARGTPLVAIESGTIVQSGWHWSGGFGVYLEGYYSADVYYYAHMTWTAPGVAPGMVVEAGDLLGWVGSTGNADSPHLHLGWIPENQGRWVDLDGLADPYPLLVGLCGPG